MALHPDIVNFQSHEQNSPTLTHCMQSKTTSKAHTGVKSLQPPHLLSVTSLSLRETHPPQAQGSSHLLWLWLWQVLNLPLLTLEHLRVTWLFLSASKRAQGLQPRNEHIRNHCVLLLSIPCVPLSHEILQGVLHTHCLPLPHLPFTS